MKFNHKALIAALAMTLAASAHATTATADLIADNAAGGNGRLYSLDTVGYITQDDLTHLTLHRIDGTSQQLSDVGGAKFNAFKTNYAGFARGWGLFAQFGTYTGPVYINLPAYPSAVCTPAAVSYVNVASLTFYDTTNCATFNSIKAAAN